MSYYYEEGVEMVISSSKTRVQYAIEKELASCVVQDAKELGLGVSDYVGLVLMMMSSYHPGAEKACDKFSDLVCCSICKRKKS